MVERRVMDGGLWMASGGRKPPVRFKIQGSKNLHSTIYYPLFTIHYPLSTIHHPPFVIFTGGLRPPLAIHHPPSLTPRPSRRARLGILDPSVVDGGQRDDHAFFNGAEFAERESAVVELSAAEALFGDVADEAFDARGRGIDQRATGAFNGVGQHKHGGFLGLRLGAWVAERAFINLGAVRIGLLLLLGGPVVEKLDPRGAVMLGD